MGNARLAAIKKLAQEARLFAKEGTEAPKKIHEIVSPALKKPTAVPKNNKTAITELAEEIMTTDNVTREEALKIATREVQLAEKMKRVEKVSNENQYFKKRDHSLDNNGGLQGSFDDQNYPTLGRVTMKMPDGSPHMDYLQGLNKGHIEQEARFNWPHASDIEVQGTLKNPDYKKAAIMAAMGAGAATLGGSEDAEAAGLMTIAKKLGVSLEEAKRLKDLAPNIKALDEGNIRDIKKVSNFQRSRNAAFEAGKVGHVPEGYKKLGSGVDYIAYETPDGDVIKMPRDTTEPHTDLAINPSVVNEVGMGPRTKTIRTNNKQYMVQDKVKPLDEASPQDFNVRKLIGDLDFATLTKNQKRIAEAHLIRDQDDILHDPATAFQVKTLLDADRAIPNYLEPRDLRNVNIGMNEHGDPTILDTSRFGEIRTDEMPERMKKKVLSDYIALPKQKQEMKRTLGVSDDVDMSNIDLENPKNVKFADKSDMAPIELNDGKSRLNRAAGVAGAGGVAMGGELGARNAPSDDPQQAPVKQPSMFDKVMSKGKELGMYGLGKAVEAYDGLDQDTKYNLEAGMNVLSQPSAALKGGVLAAQKGEGLSGIYEGAKTAWNDPETAPTGVDIAEAMNIDDSNVLTKTGVSTAAEMLDPIDALGFGGAIKGARAASRLNAIRKLK